MLTAANAFTWEQRDRPSKEIFSVCVYFLLGIGFPKKKKKRLIKIKEGETHQKTLSQSTESKWGGDESTYKPRHQSVYLIIEWHILKISHLSSDDTAVQTNRPPTQWMHLSLKATSHSLSYLTPWNQPILNQHFWRGTVKAHCWNESTDVQWKDQQGVAARAMITLQWQWD